ncbi:hypothetical protein FQA47_006893 [Oryzias melastigma]|uniref:Uncharacterized protein n=1 Tax=Oryzias melastigma TaxID=30732 RepID=A0A834CJ94_ORYME|nr:hypothetical protein FQA47_006893 [Oryzias melastigma]
MGTLPPISASLLSEICTCSAKHNANLVLWELLRNPHSTQAYRGVPDQTVRAILANISSQQNDDASMQAFSCLVCSQGRVRTEQSSPSRRSEFKRAASEAKLFHEFTIEIRERLHGWRPPGMLSHTEDSSPDYRGYSSVHMSHSEEGADRFTKMRLFNEVYF